jgi:hypothetical protein
VTEEIAEYVERKRYLGVHGNHLEIQALSELYNRPIHIYCYSTGIYLLFLDFWGKNSKELLLGTGNADCRVMERGTQKIMEENLKLV